MAVGWGGANSRCGAWIATPFGWLAPRLEAARARAAQRAYAPGGHGQRRAAAEFAESMRVMG